MAALATSADVEAQLGRSLTSDEEERVDSLLNWASQVARRASRRQFSAGTYTVARQVRRGRDLVTATYAHHHPDYLRNAINIDGRKAA